MQKNNDIRILCDRLRMIRSELSMTQEDMARIIGIGKSALSMIETGRASLSERNRNILIQTLNVNPEWLESGTGAMCDGAIYVVGDSMYPLLKSGDIVLYKQLNDINDIFWGDMYLLSIDIDGEEYITVKYIQKSDKEGCVRLVSQNVHHADKDVEISRIRALAFVKASIRMAGPLSRRRAGQRPVFLCKRRGAVSAVAGQYFPGGERRYGDAGSAERQPRPLGRTGCVAVERRVDGARPRGDFACRKRVGAVYRCRRTGYRAAKTGDCLHAVGVLRPA